MTTRTRQYQVVLETEQTRSPSGQETGWYNSLADAIKAAKELTRYGSARRVFILDEDGYRVKVYFS
jgi:hypothetical protein